jgi:hypothetical protein
MHAQDNARNRDNQINTVRDTSWKRLYAERLDQRISTNLTGLDSGDLCMLAESLTSASSFCTISASLSLDRFTDFSTPKSARGARRGKASKQHETKLFNRASSRKKSS